MQDNKSISRDGTDKQNLPYSLGRFWPLLAALGTESHFRLAAFGRFSSERVKARIATREKL